MIKEHYVRGDWFGHTVINQKAHERVWELVSVVQGYIFIFDRLCMHHFYQLIDIFQYFKCSYASDVAQAKKQ